VISSLAGRVSNPVIPAGEIRIGGFGGTDGLIRWMHAESVDAVVDATHPFAQTISAHAAVACARSGVPLLRLERPGWQPGPGDDWCYVRSLREAASILPSVGTRVFLTTGRQSLAEFAALDQLWFLIRCVDPPSGAMPANAEVLLARGPFEREAERDLLRRFAIDVVVTKDSGGSLTAGKLDAARDLGIPVVLVSRPAPGQAPSVAAVGDAAGWVLGQVRRPARPDPVPAGSDAE
jgi:precorrin-6A/cobalt-precorrin-6A reductase